MTWLLVITVPLSLIIKPEPKEEAYLSVGLSKSLNISSNGDPGGNWKGNWFEVVFTVWVVEIFTTDGINFSAKSANESGTAWTYEEKPTFKIKETKNIFFIKLI